MKQEFWDSLPASVNWSEGMNLTPQHFQQDQIYWEAQVQALRTSLSPHSWGINQLEFNNGLLDDGILSITKISAIMPDGLLINFNEQDGDCHLNLKLADIVFNKPRQEQVNQSDKKYKWIIVYLAVPRRAPGCASETATIRQRYGVVSGESEVDDNTGEGNVAVNRLQPKLSLHAVQNLDKKYVGLPLLEIVMPDEGKYRIGDYCPPIIHIGAQAFAIDDDKKSDQQPIQQRCQALAVSIRKKAHQLAGYSEAGDERLGHKISEIHRRWIRVLTKTLPEFELIADSKHSSPGDLYIMLARMVGAFSELDLVKFPPKLPVYRHDDVIVGFNQALQYIQAQLKIVNLRYTSIHFEEGQNGIFTLQYDKAWLGQDLLVELVAKEGGNKEELTLWINDCRVASRKMHEQLAKNRMLGAKTEPANGEDLDTGVTVQDGSALFLIRSDAKNILAGQQLVILCTDGKLKSLQPKRITLHLPNKPRMRVAK